MVRSKETKTSRKATIAKKRESSKQEKRICNARARVSAIACLPSDMMMEVLARVAATSVVDLHSCKLSCKALHKISNEKQVLQHVAMESLPFYTWHKTDKAKSFDRKCRQSNNPEALFRRGMMQYFSRVKMEKGVKNLEMAASLGHKGAMYALGLTLLCSEDDEQKKRGVALIVDTAKVIKGRGIVDCRKTLRDMMYRIWMRNHHVLKNRPDISCLMSEQHEIWRGWGETDYYNEDCEERLICETCRCKREVDFFYKLLPTAD